MQEPRTLAPRGGCLPPGIFWMLLRLTKEKDVSAQHKAIVAGVNSAVGVVGLATGGNRIFN